MEKRIILDACLLFTNILEITFSHKIGRLCNIDGYRFHRICQLSSACSDFNWQDLFNPLMMLKEKWRPTSFNISHWSAYMHVFIFTFCRPFFFFFWSDYLQNRAEGVWLVKVTYAKTLVVFSSNWYFALSSFRTNVLINSTSTLLLLGVKIGTSSLKKTKK